jgi:hypothetical protein
LSGSGGVAKRGWKSRGVAGLGLVVGYCWARIALGGLIDIFRFYFGTSVKRGPGPNLPQFVRYLRVENRMGTDFLRFDIFRFDFRYFSVRFRFSVFHAQVHSRATHHAYPSTEVEEVD